MGNKIHLDGFSDIPLLLLHEITLSSTDCNAQASTWLVTGKTRHESKLKETEQRVGDTY